MTEGRASRRSPASDDSEHAGVPFDPEAIDPRTAAFNARLERALAGAPRTEAQAPAALRAAREAFPPIPRDPAAREQAIAGPGGALTLRILPVPSPRGVYLHLHGGGWVLGRAHHQDPMLRALADACGVTVVSVDYRLAPEHPHPAANDDAEAAALWLIEHARRELGADRLLLGGESAGAQLAVTTLVRLRDRHGLRGFRAAALAYGTYDLALTPSARAWGERNLMLPTSTIRWYAEQYAPPERRRDPDVSPLFADLRGLPPALFTVGTLDPLLDDTRFLHARWRAAGNAAELALHPGAVHAFLEIGAPLAADAQARIHRFLSEALRDPAPAPR